MFKSKWILGGFAAMLLAVSAAPASAQGFQFGIGFSKHRRHGHFGIGFGVSGHGHGHGHGHVDVHCAPVVPVHVHGPCCGQWVPAHEEVVTEQVWRDGFWQTVSEPVYETRFDACGRPFQVCVGQATRQVFVPGRFEAVSRTVIVPARFVQTCGF